MSVEPNSDNIKSPKETTEEASLKIPLDSSPIKTDNVVLEESIETAANKIADAVEEATEKAVENIVEEVLSEKAGDLVGDLAGDLAGDLIGDLAGDISEELSQSVMLEVKASLADVGVKASTLTLIIKYTMEAIEKTPVKGPQQLDFALRIIGDLIQELPETEEKQFLVQTYKNGGIKDTIELVVDATKGKLNINQVAEVATTNFLQPCIDYIMGKCR